MSICPNSGRACQCQPQDGVMCPHGPTPNDWKPWAPEPMCQHCGVHMEEPFFHFKDCQLAAGVALPDGGQQ